MSEADSGSDSQEVGAYDAPGLEELDLLERGGIHEQILAPALVILPDPESRVDSRARVLGRIPLERLDTAATAAGFASSMLAPGTRVALRGARETATGDPVGRPALVVYEGSCIHPHLLGLMVAHPLEPDERFSLYDEAGRPTACFVGRLDSIPPTMPISEELPWPDELGPGEVVRIVYDEDRGRAEALVLRSESVLDVETSWWRRHTELPTLRWMANARRPLPQLELLALVLALGSLPLALWGTHLGLVLAAVALLLGVHTSSLLPRVRRLRKRQSSAASASSPEARFMVTDDALARGTRPLGQAALMGGLTYVLVAPTDRSGVAATVLLAAGAASVLLSLFQARLMLRGRPADVFALPEPHAVASRLGFRWPAAIDGAPVVESLTLMVATVGMVELCWSVLAAAAVARLWRWFVAGSLPLGLEERLLGSSSPPSDGDASRATLDPERP